MSYLSAIFARKGEEVAEAKTACPLSDLKARARDAGPTRGFIDALANSDRSPALIAEVKKASPSQGIIREDFDPVELASQYRDAGANCLSVLTDEPFFMGSLRNLSLARNASGLPVLRKDFIFDVYQIWEARASGADAILLIAAMLDEPKLRDLYALSKELGMDVLVEIHDEKDSLKAEACRPSLVGVNNRDLETFQTDLQSTERLAPHWRERALLVSESALASKDDVVRVHRAGARAVLIGTSFCAAPNPGQKVREVMGW